MKRSNFGDATSSGVHGVKSMLTTWSYFPVPMTPEHAAVVRDMAAGMGACLPLQVRQPQARRRLHHK